ncbi:MAG: hypothetical protein ACYDFU_00520 [Nitrospirota bacterium]
MVEFENDAVRVLRIKLGANEKSVMRGHPAGGLSFLRKLRVLFCIPAIY